MFDEVQVTQTEIIEYYTKSIGIIQGLIKQKKFKEAHAKLFIQKRVCKQFIREQLQKQYPTANILEVSRISPNPNDWNLFTVIAKTNTNDYIVWKQYDLIKNRFTQVETFQEQIQAEKTFIHNAVSIDTLLQG